MSISGGEFEGDSDMAGFYLTLLTAFMNQFDNGYTVGYVDGYEDAVGGDDDSDITFTPYS